MADNIFIVTEDVLKRIDRYMMRIGQVKLLRLELKRKSNCSHIKYGIKVIDGCEADDICFSFGDVNIIINKDIFPAFNGAVLCWRDTPTASGFKVVNLNINNLELTK